MTNSNQENSNWESFWKKNPTEFNSTMAQSTLFFAESLAEKFPISSKNHFLDIGCGPGFLIDYLKDKCELIHGTDISEKYIEICKHRFESEKNCLINGLGYLIMSSSYSSLLPASRQSSRNAITLSNCSRRSSL